MNHRRNDRPLEGKSRSRERPGFRSRRAEILGAKAGGCTSIHTPALREMKAADPARADERAFGRDAMGRSGDHTR